MRLAAVLENALRAVASIALLGIVLLTVVDVLTANLFGRPITGAYEWVETALVFALFLGLPEVFRREQNITVDIIDSLIGEKGVAILRGLAALLGLAFLIAMFWAMLPAARDAVRFGDVKADAGIPVWVLWVAILVGTLLAIAWSAVVLKRRLLQRG